jgi:hypothetical protein
MSAPVLKSIAPISDRPGFVVVEVEGVPPFTVNAKRLGRYRSLCNVIRFRFGIEFDPASVSPADWAATVAEKLQTERVVT